MIFRLIYLNGPHKGERITVTKEPMTIGSSSSCVLPLPEDPEIAKEHCTITHRENDELTIHDNGSMSRILLNSHEVNDAKLKHGDTIEIGRTRFLVQAFVQAEVNRSGTPTSQRRSRPVVPIIMLTLLVAASAFGIHKWRERRKADTERAIEKEIIPPALFRDIEATESNPAPVAVPDAVTPAPAPPPESHTPVTPPPQAPRPAPPPEPEPVRQEPVPAPEVRPPIIITGLSQQKFPQKDEYDEMRVVTLTLGTTGSVIDDTKVAVKFDFFDRDLSSGDITPARALVPIKAIQTTQLGSSGEETLTAAYTVPKGLRSAPSANSGMTFYGVHVRVMYSGELVAEKAIPRTLLDKD